MLPFIQKIKDEKKLFGISISKGGVVTYIRSLGWVSLAKLITLPLSFITVAYVARVFGPTNFGTINYVLSVNILFAVLANLGIDNAVYKELLVRKEERDKILGSAIALKVCTSLIAFVGSSIAILSSHESSQIKILVIVAAVQFLTQPLLLLSFDFLKEKETKYVTVAQITTSIISSVLKVALVTWYPSLLLFILITAIENMVTSGMYVYFIVFVKKWNIRLSLSRVEFVELLKLALPLALFSASTELYSRIDQVMLKHYLDIS